MKRISCEMCGSNDVIKQDGLYMCRNCGTKYTVEEARKLMVDGVVDVSGSTVKIDSSDELKNLYTLARRARDESDLENQYKYYEMILRKDPNSWEAYLYYRITKILIDHSMPNNSWKDSARTVFGLIWEEWDKDHNDQKTVNAIKQVVGLYDARIQAIRDYTDQIFFRNMALDHTRGYKEDCKANYYRSMIEIEDMLLYLGDTIEIGFQDIQEVQLVITYLWERAIIIDVSAYPYLRKADQNNENDRKKISAYVKKIRIYHPGYEIPETPKKKKGFGSLLDKIRI